MPFKFGSLKKYLARVGTKKVLIPVRGSYIVHLYEMDASNINNTKTFALLEKRNFLYFK